MPCILKFTSLCSCPWGGMTAKTSAQLVPLCSHATGAPLYGQGEHLVVFHCPSENSHSWGLPLGIQGMCRESFFHGAGSHHREEGKGRKGTEVKGPAGWAGARISFRRDWVFLSLNHTQCCQMGRKPCFGGYLAHFYANVLHN